MNASDVLLRQHQPTWTLVVAMSCHGVIGRDGELPWRLSSDLQRFKRMTMGHCLVMGRKTYQSIGRPLPGRQTIVLSRKGELEVPDEVTVVTDLTDVDEHVLPGKQVMVVGGAQVYAAALPCCSTMWITRVLANVQGNIFFPPIDWTAWQQTHGESCHAGPRDDCPTEFQIWQRKLIR